jgi:uncharacterized protein (DUF1330 family)
MAAYVIVDIVVHDSVVYETYKPLAAASIAAFGGRYAARGGATQVLEGSWSPHRLVILEFPDADRARSWWASAEYAEAKALRHASASANMVLVEGT